jgi:hypothetical protein
MLYSCRMERPITRSLLATFIEYAARGCVTPLEWSRFGVQHYADERMEDARRECVRILRDAEYRKVSKADLDLLYSIAEELRASERS